MAAYDDLNGKRIFTVGVLSVVITVIAALAVQVVYFYMAQSQSAATAAASDYRRQNLFLEQQQAEIATYGVDPQTGNIIIPIDVAIDKMVRDAQQNSAPAGSSAAIGQGTGQETGQETEQAADNRESNATEIESSEET
jgi:hypothetical protein